MSLEKKLEEFKQTGVYAINFFFGENIGCDDLDVLLSERRIKLIGYPVGCLGETKIYFGGSLRELLEFDFKSVPDKLSNPPTEEETALINKGGWFIWGTKDGVETTMKRNWV